MLANSSKYALTALIFLVNNSSKEDKLQAKYIAESTGIPKPFLSKILQVLATKNYLSSSKGPNGGFYISESQLSHSLLDIIVEVEGRDRMHQCALNFKECDTQNPCPIHNIIAPAANELRQNYERTTLKDLKQES